MFYERDRQLDTEDDIHPTLGAFVGGKKGTLRMSLALEANGPKGGWRKRLRTLQLYTRTRQPSTDKPKTSRTWEAKCRSICTQTKTGHEQSYPKF